MYFMYFMYTTVPRAVLPCTHKKITIFRGAQLPILLAYPKMAQPSNKIKPEIIANA
jgi:hypothetical protein